MCVMRFRTLNKIDKVKTERTVSDCINLFNSFHGWNNPNLRVNWGSVKSPATSSGAERWWAVVSGEYLFFACQVESPESSTHTKPRFVLLQSTANRNSNTKGYNGRRHQRERQLYKDIGKTVFFWFSNKWTETNGAKINSRLLKPCFF